MVVVNQPNQFVTVILQNVGPVPVWISSNRESMDGSLDSTGTPQEGFVLQPNSSPFMIERFRGILYARAQAFGGLIQCESYPCS